MNMKSHSLNSRLASVLLVIVVAVADVLMSFISIGLGLDDGTIPDPADLDAVEGLKWARYAIVPLLAPLGALALIWRHRFPRSVAAATAVLGALSLSGIAFIVALYLLAKRGFDWAVAAIILLCVAAEMLLVPESMDWQIALLGVAMLTAIAALGAYRGQRARHREDQMMVLRERAEQVEAKHAADVENSRLTERHRIAREMHDTLAHRMSLVAVQAAALQVDAPDEETASAAKLIRETAHAAMGELRDVLGVLHEDGTTENRAWKPVMNPGAGAAIPSDQMHTAPSGIAQISGLLEEWRQAGVAVGYTPNVELELDIPDTVSRAAFRVVQEGITNVARHAPEAYSEVSLYLADNDLAITVTNGPGEAAEAVVGSGLGLVGLAERIQLLGGTLEYGPTGDGFELSARIPVPEQPADNEEDDNS